MLWRAVLCVGLSLCASVAYAWSAKGHAVIAQTALQALPLVEQRYFNQQAEALLRNEKAQDWRRNLKHHAAFAQAAVWPDTRRDQTFASLYSRYGQAVVPSALKSYAPFTTGAWHYVNAAYWDPSSQRLITAGQRGQRCFAKPKGQLVNIWPALVAAFTQAKTPAERGLIVAFISHLLADAYQPLHGFAAFDSACHTDAGGNAHCLIKNKKGRCSLNLHRLWDGGFGAFDAPAPLLPPVKVMAPRAIDAVVINALQVTNEHAAFVYSAQAGLVPNKRYKSQGLTLTQQHSHAASAVLAQVLTTLYKKVTHGQSF